MYPINPPSLNVAAPIIVEDRMWGSHIYNPYSITPSDALQDINTRAVSQWHLSSKIRGSYHISYTYIIIYRTPQVIKFVYIMQYEICFL